MQKNEDSKRKISKPEIREMPDVPELHDAIRDCHLRIKRFFTEEIMKNPIIFLNALSMTIAELYIIQDLSIKDCQENFEMFQKGMTMHFEQVKGYREEEELKEKEANSKPKE